MADRAIGSLTQTSTLSTNDLLLLQHGSSAMSITGGNLTTQLINAITGHGGIVSVSVSDSGTSGNGAYHTITLTLADGTTSEFVVRDGLKGTQGDAKRVFIKYAGQQPTSNADMGTTPDAWMGVAVASGNTAPTSYTSYAWYKIKGEVGPGAAITSRTVQYQASTSPTTPTGTWQNTVPTVSPGQYLWAHISMTFSGGDGVDWYEVAYQGTNGVNGTGAVATVNGISPDAEDHDVTVTADDIEYETDTSVADALDTLTENLSGKQSAVTGYGILKAVGSGVTSIATLGTDYGSVAFTAQLSTWNSNACTISDARFVTSGYSYFVSPTPSDLRDYNEAEIYADDVTTAGQMTFHCSAAPSSALTVNISRMVSA